MPILNYKDLDSAPGINTGGVTGSQRRTMRGMAYQIKPSILDNPSTFRRLKAGNTDRENFGEFIAASIARSLFETTTGPKADGFEGAPEVFLVYDDEGQSSTSQEKRILVASKYFVGDERSPGEKPPSVRTLDEYIKEQSKLDIEGKNHARFVSTLPDPEKREFDLRGDDEVKTNLRRGIARGIALSALLGDHDFNPSNFIVVTKTTIDPVTGASIKKDHIQRIDFGHAFNDLLNAPEEFGGKVQNTQNPILDFLNRKYIAGSRGLMGGDHSKLWRDYPGMIPTQELADEFKALAESTGLKAGVRKAYNEFIQLLTQLEMANDTEGIEHLKKSLNAISLNLTGINIDAQLSPRETLITAFENIYTFTQKTQRRMKEVANLMQLQVNIDKMIEELKENKTPSPELMTAIRKAYNELSGTPGAPGIKLKDGIGIEWIKTDVNEQNGFVGNLDEYIKYRGEQLGYVNKKQLQRDQTGIDQSVSIEQVEKIHRELSEEYGRLCRGDKNASRQDRANLILGAMGQLKIMTNQAKTENKPISFKMLYDELDLLEKNLRNYDTHFNIFRKRFQISITKTHKTTLAIMSTLTKDVTETQQALSNRSAPKPVKPSSPIEKQKEMQNTVQPESNPVSHPVTPKRIR